MLSPNARKVYLEQLRPPAGYRLDRAVATTFSLDLVSLLLAPLSMALSDCRNREEALRDPIAILEALRQTSDRFTVFCQRGRIAVPRADTQLYSYLENVVVEVQPPNADGVFHPKTWTLRFIGEDTDQPIIYRFLCLSRNLTFDRSWDTILALEGALESRKRGFGRNRPLVHFIRALPDLAAAKVPTRVHDAISLLAREVSRVRFQSPDGFEDELRFVPLGIAGYRRRLRLDDHRRLLIVSPFLSDDTLTPLTSNGDDNILISRQESLDDLAEDTVESLEEFGKIYFMDQAAERPSDFDDSEQEDEPVGATQIEDSAVSGRDTGPGRDVSQPTGHGVVTPPSSSDLSGLHAKLFIRENGWYVRILTGSANATEAALSGRNVELLVELVGRRSKFGIDAFLGSEDDRLTFRNMLRRYIRGDARVEADQTRRALEKALEEARRALTRVRFSIRVSGTSTGNGDCYSWLLTPKGKRVGLPATVSGVCRPITIQVSDSLDLRPLLRGTDIVFPELSLAALTSFVAFELTAESKGQRSSISFVLNLPAIGFPTDRDKRLLREIVADRARFIRYLLLILTGEDGIQLPTSDGRSHTDGWANTGHPWLSGPALLEELVRAYSRRPEAIDRIARLVDDLRASGQSQDVFPRGFEELWDIFLEARGSAPVSSELLDGQS